MNEGTKPGRELSRHWPLDPDATYLNHGSYGSTPWRVLYAQSEWRARMEREPVRFLSGELEGHLDNARARLGEFLGASPDDLAFVPNATSGVNTVLRSLEFHPGDEILVTDHEYNACLNAIRAIAKRAGGRAVVAQIPVPLHSPDEVIEAVLASAGPRTRLAVISHVSSSTGLVLPIERIVSALAERGIDTLVDGAHAPGMLPLDIDALGAAYYTGNAHKWICAPKGAGFLHVRRDRHDAIRPLVISHGANSPRSDRSRFRLEFDWTGTVDPSAYLAIPAALDFFAALLDGGLVEAMEVNRRLALVGRQKLLEVVGTPALAPESMIGSMAAIELPADFPPPVSEPAPGSPADSTWPLDPLHDLLIDEYAIQVPVYAWPHTPSDGPRRRLLRISAQLYNDAAQYERLATVLSELRLSPDGSATEVKRALARASSTIRKQREGGVSVPGEYSDNQWQRLVDAGPQIALAVAASSGSVGQSVAELDAFLRLVDDTADESDGADLLGRMAADVRSKLAAGMLRGHAQDAIPDGIQAAREAGAILAVQADEQEARIFRQWLLQVAHTVAGAARDGGVLGLGGDEVSKLERETMAAIADGLGAGEETDTLDSDEPVAAAEAPKKDAPEVGPDGQPIGADNIRDGHVRGLMGGPNQSQGEGQGG